MEDIGAEAPRFRRASVFTPIDALSRRLGVTSRALRHYEEKGLIPPCRRNRRMRAYDEETIALIETIVTLRKVDLPLATIRLILDQRTTPQLQQATIRRALTERLEQKRKEVAELGTLLDAHSPPDKGRD